MTLWSLQLTGPMRRSGERGPVLPRFRPESAVLTDTELRRARNRGDLHVDPFDETMIRPAALSLRLGTEAHSLVANGPVDIAVRETHPVLRPKELDEQGRLALWPGEVVLAATMERIGISDRLVGLLDGTSDYARLGISVVLSHQVSPGFGRDDGAIITLEIVSRLSEVVYLHPGTRICNLMLLRCRGSARPYGEMPHNYSRDQVISPSRLAD